LSSVGICFFLYLDRLVAAEAFAHVDHAASRQEYQKCQGMSGRKMCRD
jgi:hypothetical protein